MAEPREILLEEYPSNPRRLIVTEPEELLHGAARTTVIEHAVEISEIVNGESVVPSATNAPTSSKSQLGNDVSVGLSDPKAQGIVGAKQCHSDGASPGIKEHEQRRPATKEPSMEQMCMELSAFASKVSLWEDANSGLNSKVDTLSEENRKLNIQNQILRSKVAVVVSQRDHQKAINEETGPFVRDHHAVALRTLLDGVLVSLGWRGEIGRGAFMAANARHILRVFGNKFSYHEIYSIIS
jgi:regulator of replication initiation timing